MSGRSSFPCFIADTTAPTRDTIFVIGVETALPDSAWVDCQYRVVRASPAPTVLDLAPDSGLDLRDALDRGIPISQGPLPDVVVTRDPDVIAYAARHADYFVTALPWNRTYVLIVADADSAERVPADSERAALARDAVTADARGARAPFGWLSDHECSTPVESSGIAPRPIVAYATGDEIARQLAERIVSLAGGRVRPDWVPEALARATSTALRVAPINADSIPGALAGGSAAAGVAPLLRDWQARCGTRTQPVAGRLIPLVDSRAHAIVRRGSGAAFIVGIDGALAFTRRTVR